jgi:hypothetical protein
VQNDITISNAPKVNPETPDARPVWRANRAGWFDRIFARARRRWTVVTVEGTYPAGTDGDEVLTLIDGETRRAAVAVEGYSAVAIAEAMSRAFALGFAAGVAHQSRVDRRMRKRGGDSDGPQS